MNKTTLISLFLLSTTLIAKAQNKPVNYPYSWETTSNPIVTHTYTADPSAKVLSDNKVWIFSSHDQDKAKGFYSMRDYHLFSTDDMKHWIDYGSVFSLDDVSWANSHLWAPDFCEKNGKYYLYAPANFRIGVFVSDKPQGPYKDAIGRPLVPINEVIDPMIFIDDDGKAYLYFSRRGKYCYVVKLKDNMIEIDGEIQEITNESLRSTKDGEYFFVEGPYLHKHENKYYLTYPAKRYKHGAPRNQEGNEVICYAVSDSPMGPFKYMGKIMDENGTHTIHQSVINFKGENYIFYHTGELARRNGEWEYARQRRSICVNKLTYNPDGTINFIQQNEDINK